MNLKEARFKKGLTQFDLRLKTGINQATISHFERGYLIPNDEKRRKLAKALNLTAKDLDF